MIFVIIICSILYIILYSLLYYLYIEYKRDYNEIEIRLTRLESKINNYDRYIENELKTAKLRMFFEDIKKENNTQESGEYDMPCGRKKGRGGRRK